MARTMTMAEANQIAQKRIDELEAQLPRWIPCSEHPPRDDMYLVVCEFLSRGRRMIGTEYWDDEEGWCVDEWRRPLRYKITHWMEYPDLPREGE